MILSRSSSMSKNYINTRRAIISAAVGFVLAVILYLFCSLLVLISLLPEGAIRATSLIISLITSYCAGFLTARNVPMYGLLNGLATGLIYFLITYIFGVIINASFAFNSQLLTSLITMVIGSAIGGIVGINYRASRNRRVRRYRRR